MTKHLTDTAIQMRVVPTRLRWPETGTTTAWTKAHDCVNALQKLVRNVDLGCLRRSKTVNFLQAALPAVGRSFAIRRCPSWRASYRFRSRRKL